MEKLTLNIDGHKTGIEIGRGLLGTLPAKLAPGTIYLVDENVLRIYGSFFAGKPCISIPQGETQKTLGFVQDIYRQMVEFEADRTSFLVGVGGGLVTDVAGFVASTFMRGIKFGFVSTTLLGQVDASIGGKNGVNLDGYKNMIGIINQPEFVLCDLDLLGSLQKEEMVSGFAEVIKYGAIRDAHLFSFLESNYKQVLEQDKLSLQKVVAQSAAIKVGIVESDVNENGDRKLLNFGHTLGHAIEKLTGMLHGNAVAIGMVLSGRLSVNMGFLKAGEADRLENLIKQSGLPVSTELTPETIFETLLKDKKRAGNSMHFILLKSLGDAFVQRMDLETLKGAINDLY